jgi:hypothetical protein
MHNKKGAAAWSSPRRIAFIPLVPDEEFSGRYEL